MSAWRKRSVLVGIEAVPSMRFRRGHAGGVAAARPTGAVTAKRRASRLLRTLHPPVGSAREPRLHEPATVLMRRRFRPAAASQGRSRGRRA